jgi:hypothetical protein
MNEYTKSLGDKEEKRRDYLTAEAKNMKIIRRIVRVKDKLFILIQFSVFSGPSQKAANLL